jgi:hypothetical protein
MIWNGFSALATVYDSDGSSTNVQFIHDTLAQDGDTISLPAGTFTWASKVIITKGVKIEGVGIGATLITSNIATETVLEFQTATKMASVSGIMWTGYSGSSGGTSGIIVVGGASNWRVHDCKFNIYHRGVSTYSGEGGVVDHCEFQKISGSPQGVSVFGNRDASWNIPLSLGTINAVYIEDCTFTWPNPADSCLDMYNGARAVFRHNTVTNASVGCHGLDSGGYRSALSWEFYGNQINVSSGVSLARAFHLRGGTGVVFDNQITVTGSLSSNAIDLACYRATGTCIVPGYAPWGFITGSNPYDGDIDNGWPALDQVGASPPTDPPNISASPPPVHSVQGHQAAYAWGNTKNGLRYPFGVDSCSGTCCPDGSPGHPNPASIIQEDRDFVNDTPMPGYTPYIYPHPLVTGGNPTPTPSPTPTPTPSATATSTPTATATATATATGTATPTATETPTVTPTIPPPPTVTPTATATPTPPNTPTATPVATATPTPTPTPAGITLVAHGYRVQGRHVIDLSWTGATSGNVDIFRNGTLIATVPNTDGAYTDSTGDTGGHASYTYEVCEASSTNCSNEVTITF